MKADAARNALVGVVAALIAVLLLAAGFLGRVVTEPDTTVVAAPAAAPADASGDGTAGDVAAQSEINGATLDEVMNVLAEDFVDPDRVNAEYLYEAAVNGVFQALGDPHSTYIDPDTYAVSRDDFSGTFQGIGATVSQQGSFVIIVRPIDGTPAAEAGLQAGDTILEVDGEDAEGWTVQQAVLRIRGPRGTAVELKVRHVDGTEEVLSIVRDEIQVTSVSFDPPGGVLRDSDGNEVTDLFYMRIRSITRTTPQEVRDAVRQAIDENKRGILIDVRGDPGGLLVETTEVADMFLDTGTILVQVDREGNERIATATDGTITDLPIVVLQDEFSASGSELFAAALQENDRAMVVGNTSFGKGTVNHVRELSNGGAVYVSIARWLTPDRNQIEGRGIIPDIPVTLTVEDIEAGRDVAMFRAIDVMRAQIATGEYRPPISTAG